MEFHKVRCCIADFVIDFNMRYPSTAYFCREYISKTDKEADFTVETTMQQLEKERELSDGDFSLEACELNCLYRNLCHVLPKKDAFMFHSSMISVDEKGYGFFGRSGAGKSTHTALWQDILGDKMTVVNGDKPIIRKINGKFIAYGTPWCGKEGIQTNTSTQVKAICQVNKAADNKITKMTADEAASAIISQVLISSDGEAVAKTLELLDEFVKSVDVWKLECNISKEAAMLSYNTMKE